MDFRENAKNEIFACNPSPLKIVNTSNMIFTHNFVSLKFAKHEQQILQI
jgi:hypothetical protein